MITDKYILAVFLLLVAVLLMVLNLKSPAGPGKFVSYLAMWTAIIASVLTALGVSPL